jgi:hypothetical protein
VIEVLIEKSVFNFDEAHLLSMKSKIIPVNTAIKQQAR